MFVFFILLQSRREEKSFFAARLPHRTTGPAAFRILLPNHCGTGPAARRTKREAVTRHSSPPAIEAAAI